MLTEHVAGNAATISLRDVPDGLATLRVVAEGTQARYRLSYTEDSLPLSKPEPAFAELVFHMQRHRR